MEPKQIIFIGRAREDWIQGFIETGILEVTEDGLRVKEIDPI